MNHDAGRVRRFETAHHDRLPEEIDGLALELAEVARATASDQVSISTRAEYLRAQDAHRRAVAAWAVASGKQQLAAVHDALEQCRSALESTRARLER